MVDLTNQVQIRLKITRLFRKNDKKTIKNGNKTAQNDKKELQSLIQSQKITEEMAQNGTKRHKTKIFKDMYINNKYGM